eukprot:TRINITY_DN192_c1_g1_i1.p1 TRINITY_DN192_c1_g1~~TRINITY_DN192_c1_g1_i1.p1  ORF type:complete len:118 (-),score=46.56 TRINITY_DN192_c1_g1_i1:79-396(-)
MVYLGKWRNGNCVVKKMVDGNSSEIFWQEVQSMRNIRPHPNICRLLGICSDPEKPLAIVMEYLPGGSLSSALPRINMTPVIVKRIARDIINGMHHLHVIFNLDST